MRLAPLHGQAHLGFFGQVGLTFGTVRLPGQKTQLGRPTALGWGGAEVHGGLAGEAAEVAHPALSTLVAGRLEPQRPRGRVIIKIPAQWAKTPEGEAVGPDERAGQ